MGLSAELVSRLTAPPGGVMTEEVGVVTGDLEPRTRCRDDGATSVQVRYAGADEWYTLSGAGCRLHDPADAQVLHQTLAAVLHRPQG